MSHDGVRLPRAPRIFYYGCDSKHPSGGEQDAYQHVDILNDSGHEAYVVHTQKGFRHTNFPNNTCVLDFESIWKIYDQGVDYWVLPEVLGPQIAMFPGRKVIFNRNLYYGFSAFGPQKPVKYVYTDESVVAAFAVSEHNVEHLRFAFPSMPVHRVFAHIDTNLFAYRPLSRKKPQIACVAKAIEPLLVLYHMLSARGVAGLNATENYRWVFVRGYTQEGVAKILQDSLILINLSTCEGLPRTVIEALACGCLVLGYGSGPLAECLPPESRCQVDDLIRMAQRIEAITSTFPSSYERWVNWSEAGRALATTFSLEQQRSSVLAAWQQILTDHCGRDLSQPLRVDAKQ